MVRKLDSRSECPYQIATQCVANRRETRRSASIFENLPVPTAQSLKKDLRVMLGVFVDVRIRNSPEGTFLSARLTSRTASNFLQNHYGTGTS